MEKPIEKDRDLLVWLDMEMTGLDPSVCVPIELAIVVTDAELVELDHMEVTIHQPEEQLDIMDDFVRKMHTSNGLLEAVRASKVSLAEAEEQAMEVLRRWTKPGEGVLSGNSIHQDRRFVVKYFPQMDKHLHYRMVDVSTLKELVRRWYGNSAVYRKEGITHTALADARASVIELAYYRERFLIPPTGPDGTSEN